MSAISECSIGWIYILLLIVSASVLIRFMFLLKTVCKGNILVENAFCCSIVAIINSSSLPISHRCSFIISFMIIVYFKKFLTCKVEMERSLRLEFRHYPDFMKIFFFREMLLMKRLFQLQIRYLLLWF